MNKQQLIDRYSEKLLTQSNSLSQAVQESRNSIFRNVIADLEQLDEPQKVKVPMFVAEWFEKNSRKLEEAIYQLNVSIEQTDEQYWGDMFRWADNPENKPIETLIRMLNGYEVEEEPKWIVKFMPKDVEDYRYYCLDVAEKGEFDITESSWTAYKNYAWEFDSKDKAEAIALVLYGTVEKV